MTDKDLRRKLSVSRNDTNKVNMLIETGSRYLYLPGEKKSDLDSSYYYFKSALRLSEELGSDQLKYKTIILIGNYYVEAGDLDSCRLAFRQGIDYYHRTGQKVLEAETWDWLGMMMDNNHKRDHEEERLVYIRKASALYRDVGNESAANDIFLPLIIDKIWAKKYDEAEQFLLKARKIHLREKRFDVYYCETLRRLSQIAHERDDILGALGYELEYVATLEKYPACANDIQQEQSNYTIARTYDYYADYSKCEHFARKMLPLTIKLNGNYILGLKLLINAMLNQGKCTEARDFLQGFVRKHPPDQFQKVTVYELLGRVDFSLNNLPAAEAAFLKCRKAADDAELWQRDRNLLAITYLRICSFYTQSGQFEKAKPYMANLSRLDMLFKTREKAIMASLRSKIDSAEGKYLSALQSYQSFKLYNDSIFNATKSEQISRLEISFGTKQKQQRIELLDAQNRVKQSQLDNATKERNLTFAGIGLMMVVSGLTYYAFRLKSRSNRLLTVKQHEINKKNQSLESTVREKEKLIVEKALLLKEVHHRVKNNLQIVMNILETRPSILAGKQAVEVMEESQHRVQAIALIHQKLYVEEGGATINMYSYISGLIAQLGDGLNTYDHQIRLELMVEPITLDIDQAVPVGLIINEAVTNSIKHAFGKEGGTVIIGLRQTGDDEVLLSISDNGRGLPAEAQSLGRDSLGLKLIRGLSRQLGGKLEVRSVDGTAFFIAFGLQRSSFRKLI